MRVAKLLDKIAAEQDDLLVLLPVASWDSEFSAEVSLDHIAYLNETKDAVKSADGTWRPGGSTERWYDEHYDEETYRNRVSLRGRLRSQLPDAFINGSSSLAVRDDDDADWSAVPISVDVEKWAPAGFDEWEKRVLRYQLREISREKALAEQPNEVERRALQAAWKRYDRTGKQRLRKIAEKVQK